MPRMLLALACSLPLLLPMIQPLPAQEGGVMAPDTAPTAELKPVGLDAQQLLEALPTSSTVVIDGDRVVWKGAAGASIPFTPIDPGQGDPRLDTTIGALAIDRKLVVDGRIDAIPRIAELVEQAKRAGLTAEGLTVKEGILTGVHLRGDTRLVLIEGVVTKVETAASPRTAQRETVEDAVKQAVERLASSPLDELGRKTVEAFLKQADAEDGDANKEIDALAPSAVRRIIRGGWLDQYEPSGNLPKAIAAAELFVPTMRFEGPGGLLVARVADAYGRDGWILRTPTRSAYTRFMPLPLYYGRVQPINLVVELPPQADPASWPDAGVEATAARLYRSGLQIATWNRADGLQVDTQRWREAVPELRRGDGDGTISGALPPHMVVAGLDGDIDGLITASGVLKAPTSEPSDAERFLRDAARALPDAAHIDLIGQYLMAYVYDSPDSRFPQLIGNREVKGDIHQTAAQTLATAIGGVTRGDCDDLSELCQVVAERQGRTAIVLSLPSHAAAAWAELQTDKKWHVFVLQTGPALEFADESLPKALEMAYKDFNASEAFDPNGLGLLLRFSGENTRSSWRLSWRIFAEPDYYKTMVEVQRDWHFQTYQRGIRTMLALIERGDNDTANFRELSGLYSFTGQYDLAAEYHQKAIDRTDPVKEAESRYLMQIEMLGHLFEAKRTDDARRLAEDLIRKQFPLLKLRLKTSAWSSGMDLVNVLTGHEANDLAIEAMQGMLIDEISEQDGSVPQQIERLAAWVASPRFSREQWDFSNIIHSLRGIGGQFTGIATAVIEKAGPKQLATQHVLQQASQAVELWNTRLSFLDVDESSEAPGRYSAAARYYAAILGQERLDRLIDGAEDPKAIDTDHTKRVGGMAQLPMDLPWIRISTPYWFTRMIELVAKKRGDATPVDAAAVAAVAARFNEADTKCRALGIESSQLDYLRHITRLIAALVAQDATEVKARLEFVKAKGDKRLRDDTAQWIGDMAKAMPMPWFSQVMQQWDSIVVYKDKYFWIAWRAGLAGAHQQALLAAKVAADRFKEDASFAEEYQFMRSLYEPAQSAK